MQHVLDLASGIARKRAADRFLQRVGELFEPRLFRDGVDQSFSSHARRRVHVWCRVHAYVVRPKTTDFTIVPPQRGQRAPSSR